LHLPMSRFDMTDYLGTAAESIARAFVEIEREGFVRRVSPRTVELLDANGLRRSIRWGFPAAEIGAAA
jgi:Crp-like helix-turn-helix domain